ncbi:hypothetical protein HanIR_Chr03g0110641 [Helianthus annuus]|nr:hypothetical protein HanIR_Chr03g0110641 [Helianthus annuus]
MAAFVQSLPLLQHLISSIQHLVLYRSIQLCSAIDANDRHMHSQTTDFPLDIVAVNLVAF